MHACTFVETEEFVPVCDGCGARVDEEHIRRRIERLEMATRFRPIHISVLLIDGAPPPRAEDFYYAVGADHSARSSAGQAYFEELAKLTGVAAGPHAESETVLAEFQRRGYFLTSAVECAVDGAEDLNAAVKRLAATVLRRVQTSYRPKHVALISAATCELIEPFRAAGWGDRLILDEGAPFAVDSIGERLAGALART
jgi:hypothetical protein